MARLFAFIILLFPFALLSQSKSTHRIRAYDQQVIVWGTPDSTFSNDSLCNTHRGDKNLFKVTGESYCKQNQMAFGTEHKKTKEKRARIYYSLTGIVRYQNTPFLSAGVHEIFMTNNNLFVRRFLLCMQYGYYFRNRPLKAHKYQRIHISYSFNIKHGLSTTFFENIKPIYRPFIGFDLALNAYLRHGLFFSYSGGYDLFGQQVYYGLGFHCILK